MTRFAILASIAVFGLGACQKGQDQAQASDSTARNLTLAPADSTATLRDMPEHQTNPPAAPPATRTPTHRTTPAPPVAPALRRLSAGATFDIAATDTISSRTAKPGEAFTARVVEDVKNAAGRCEHGHDGDRFRRSIGVPHRSVAPPAWASARGEHPRSDLRGRRRRRCPRSPAARFRLRCLRR